MLYTIEDGRLVLCMEGRVDSQNSASVQNEIDKIVSENPALEVEIDASSLSYISSAGLRVLLRLSKARNNHLTIRNVSPEVYEILDVTGFVNIMDVRKRLREVSIEGCKVIGRGAVGTVYLIDDDTIVKVYEIPDSLPMMENEQKRAKQAFLKGIPTAISYDVVKVGDKYGSMFEMLKASTYNDILRKNPERLDEIVKQFAHLVRQIHSIEMEKGSLPEAKTVFTEYLDKLEGILPADLRDRVRSLLCAMPENLHIVHGDIHMKNVMLSGDEPLLIDMDTLCVGDPVFDLMGIYVTYVLFNDDEPDNSQTFLGLSRQMSRQIWEKTILYYFDNRPGVCLDTFKARIMLVARIRFLFLVCVLGVGNKELNKVRIEHSISHIRELLEKIDSLEIGG